MTPKSSLFILVFVKQLVTLMITFLTLDPKEDERTTTTASNHMMLMRKIRTLTMMLDQVQVIVKVQRPRYKVIILTTSPSPSR
jgi:hypothetical protein